jgi:hypothetical protein
MRKMSILELDGHEYEVVDKEARERLDKMEPGNGGPSTGGGINTVEVYSKLPTDAKENDVAIVETEEYVRTESETVVEPVKINAPVEGNDYNNYVHAVFKSDFGFLLEKEEIQASGAKTLEATYSFCDDAETSIQINELSAEAASIFGGVNHAIGAVVMTTDNYSTSYIKIRGLSVKDFAINMMGLELPDDMWAAFLGPYANDNSADSPVYNWCKFVQTAEPVNENSIDMGGIYGTVLYDYEMDWVLDAPIESVSLSLTDETYENTILDEQFDMGRYSDWNKYDADTQNAILMNSNLIINHIAYDKEVEKSIDIYNRKGLFQYDNGEWVSLEEKMNTPRFVDTYADLPKTSIENGIMAVAKESRVDIEPTETTTIVEKNKLYKLKSANNITLEDFKALISDISYDYSPTDNVEAWIPLKIILSENDYENCWTTIIRQSLGEIGVVSLIALPTYLKKGENINGYESKIYRYAACGMEIPQGLSLSDLGLIPPIMGQDTPPTFIPEVGKWYWFDVMELDNGETYSVDGIFHEGFLEDYPYNIKLYGEIRYNRNEETISYDISSFNMKIFNFIDFSEIVTNVYPAGFYRYNNNEWNLVKAVSGDEFANKDVLDMLTAEDIGNIQENTEKRHEHSNKQYLDQIGQYTLDSIRDNTSARHTHSNSYYLNKITYETINNISDNTTARHTHKNSAILNKFSVNDNNELLYEQSPVPKTIKYLSLYGVSEVALERGVCKDVDDVCNNPLIITEIPVGESWLTIRPVANATRKEPLKISFPNNIVWENGICPVFRAPYTLYIKFYRMEGSSRDVHAQYYSHPNARIDSRLLQPNVDFKFAQISDSGTITFAPARSYADCSYNDDDTPIRYGYKRVIGENPIELSNSLNPDDECQLMFKEYDDFILVYWIVTPKDYRIGEYVNSSMITDWRGYFYGVDDSELDIIGRLDTSNSTGNFWAMFYNCDSLSKLPYIDTSNGNKFDSMFEFCSYLIEIPYLDISKGTSFVRMLNGCHRLETIGTLVVNHIDHDALQNIFQNNINGPLNIETVNIKGTIKLSGDLNLTRYSSLSSESLMSFINAFEDNSGEETAYTVYLGSTNLEKLTEEQKLIATNKNIILA